MTKNKPIYHVEGISKSMTGWGFTETFPSIYVPSILSLFNQSQSIHNYEK